MAQITEGGVNDLLLIEDDDSGGGARAPLRVDGMNGD